MVPVDGHFPSDGDFPAFAAAVYAETGVAGALLHWQDAHAADINLLLFACWHGLFHGDIPESTLTRALALSREWREQIIQPLRQCRRRMKHWHPGMEEMERSKAYDALRARIQAAELAAEVEQEKALQSLCGPVARTSPGQASRRQPLVANLRAYGRRAGIAADPAELTLLVDSALEWWQTWCAATQSP